ncbi:MAG: hypothetical protein EBZ49_12985 [Proteobacteria bacterium]|nr:hypothetical protein [Pseudomonadota bacterium]
MVDAKSEENHQAGKPNGHRIKIELRIHAFGDEQILIHSQQNAKCSQQADYRKTQIESGFSRKSQKEDKQAKDGKKGNGEHTINKEASEF